MSLSDSFDNILSPNLNKVGKDRLKEALEQFKINIQTFNQLNSEPENEQKSQKISEQLKKWHPKYYTNFYLEKPEIYFYQGDLLQQIRNVKWVLDDLNNEKTMQCQKIYDTALLLSNSCDVSIDNTHDLNNKQALFAPAEELEKYVDLMKADNIPQSKIDNYVLNIKSQLYSNVLFLPTNPYDKKEYIVRLDKIFWFPVNELNSYLKNIKQTRISTLDIFGHYLFIIKLAYHLNRLPEEPDRRSEYFA